MYNEEEYEYNYHSIANDAEYIYDEYDEYGDIDNEDDIENIDE